MDLDALNRRFATEGIRFENGEGGMPRLMISTALAEAEIYVHGAHVAKFAPHAGAGNGKPLLFLSKRAVFNESKPIRGGVPICFPWFGPRANDPSAPAHGFARTKAWTPESIAVNGSGEVTATFAMSADEQTRQFWPYDFTARYTVTVGEHLYLSLNVTNTGAAAFGFEEALHSYLLVGDVHSVVVHGLEGTTYLDKMKEGQQVIQADAIHFVGETDRVYLNTHSTCRVDDPANDRVIVVEKSGSRSTVVWNPWIEKSRGFSDFGDDEWPGMVCIETCNVGENAVSLSPGSNHRMTATIFSEPLQSD